MPEDLVRVLIVHPRDPAAPTLGGIQTFLRDFIRHAPDNFEISFVGTTRDLSARPVGKWHELQLHGRTVRFLAVGSSAGLSRSPAGLFRSAMGLARLWRALGARDRILQVHRPYRSFVLNHHRGPKVQFIHVDLRDWPGPHGWPKLHALYRDYSDATLERMDRVFIVNEAGAQLIRSDHPGIAERVEFLPVWYDTDVFFPVSDEERARLRREMAERLGIGAAGVDRSRLILVAIRLTEIKQPLLAIDTLAALGRQPDVRLLVAGSGELLDETRARSEQLGVADRVHFLGDIPREALATTMRASDALLLTARSEGGGPRVVLEALACGLPVVSTTVGEVRRTVTSGVNGWLVQEPDPAALAQGLTWVFGQPRPALAAEAIRAVKSYTAERTLQHLYEIYRALCGTGVPQE